MIARINIQKSDSIYIKLKHRLNLKEYSVGRRSMPNRGKELCQMRKEATPIQPSAPAPMQMWPQGLHAGKAVSKLREPELQQTKDCKNIKVPGKRFPENRKS